MSVLILAGRDEPPGPGAPTGRDEPSGPGAPTGRDEPPGPGAHTGPGIIPPAPAIPLHQRCVVSRMCRHGPGESLAEHVHERHLPAWWRRPTYCSTCRTPFRITGGWKRHRAQCRWFKLIPATLWARRVLHVVEAVGSHLQVRSGYDGLLEITREVEQELGIDWPIQSAPRVRPITIRVPSAIMAVYGTFAASLRGGI